MNLGWLMLMCAAISVLLFVVIVRAIMAAFKYLSPRNNPLL
ncbi:MAG: hypothetical protein ACR2KU_00980 [Gammaproteobacteria bacterium]